MERETLFKVVAQNNSLFIDMIANLGIKDRNYTAWNMSHLEQLNEVRTLQVQCLSAKLSLKIFLMMFVFGNKTHYCLRLGVEK